SSDRRKGRHASLPFADHTAYRIRTQPADRVIDHRSPVPFKIRTMTGLAATLVDGTTNPQGHRRTTRAPAPSGRPGNAGNRAAGIGGSGFIPGDHFQDRRHVLGFDKNQPARGVSSGSEEESASRHTGYLD